MPLFTVRFQENKDYDVILASIAFQWVYRFITFLVTGYDQHERNVPGPKPTHLQNNSG